MTAITGEVPAVRLDQRPPEPAGRRTTAAGAAGAA